MCDVRFTNDLPEVPCDPKMLVAPLDPQQLAKFHLTTLERDPKRDLVLEPDLGIPLTVFDIGRYAVPVNPPPLAPEDQALLEGDDDVALEASPAMRPRQRLRGNKAELSWLMRTTYISNDPGGQAAKGIPEKQAKVLRDAMAGTQPEDSEAHQIQQIEASFEAARRPPVHPKNPSLQALEVLPVLPDEERWPNEYVQLVFDSDPTAEVPHLRGKTAEERRRLAEEGVVKPYKISVEGRQDYSFLALLLPAQPPEGREPDAGPSEEEQELQWIREYGYDMKTSPVDQDYVFMFGDDGRVGYVDMNYRLATKRTKKGATPLSQRFGKPIRVSIKRRAPDEHEQAAHAKRLHVLNTGFEPEEEEDPLPEEEEQQQGLDDSEQQQDGVGSGGGTGNGSAGGGGGGSGQSDQASSPAAEAQQGGAAQQADANDYFDED